jgi:dUTP pyrophosphatase
MKTVPVKIKKLHKDAIIPSYQTKGSVGFDLHALIDNNGVVELKPQQQAIIGTGLAFGIPEGYEIQVRSRSGFAFKHSVTVTHGIGTVDSDYRGEVKVVLFNHGTKTIEIKHGDRIAQAVLNEVPQAEFEETDELEETERGSNGFGSTGV